jgi:hypothetical protein
MIQPFRFYESKSMGDVILTLNRFVEWVANTLQVAQIKVGSYLWSESGDITCRTVTAEEVDALTVSGESIPLVFLTVLGTTGGSRYLKIADSLSGSSVCGYPTGPLRGSIRSISVYANVLVGAGYPLSAQVRVNDKVTLVATLKVNDYGPQQFYAEAPAGFHPFGIEDIITVSLDQGTFGEPSAIGCDSVIAIVRLQLHK